MVMASLLFHCIYSSLYIYLYIEHIQWTKLFNFTLFILVFLQLRKSCCIFDVEHDGMFVWKGKYVIDIYVLLFLIIR